MVPRLSFATLGIPNRHQILTFVSFMWISRFVLLSSVAIFDVNCYCALAIYSCSMLVGYWAGDNKPVRKAREQGQHRRPFGPQILGSCHNGLGYTGPGPMGTESYIGKGPWAYISWQKGPFVGLAPLPRARASTAVRALAPNRPWFVCSRQNANALGT